MGDTNAYTCADGVSFLYASDPNTHHILCFVNAETTLVGVDAKRTTK